MAVSRYRAVLPPAEQWPRQASLRSTPITTERPPLAQEDPVLHEVAAELQRLDPGGKRFAEVIRDTFDQIYDGRRTGRWDYSQLHKTEKTHVGTLVQINLQNDLQLDDGAHLDFRIAGHEVDCKFSKDMYLWEIPGEMYQNGPQLGLMVWASDYESKWWAGLLRVEDRLLRTSRNRDQKRKLNDLGVDRLLPLFCGELVENTLLHLPKHDRGPILANRRSGQARVNELFRRLQGRLVNRATVLAVAQQEDCPKRVRDARKHLAREGIVIFGHYEPHPEYCEILGLPRPKAGQFVSARVVEADPGDARPTIDFGGRAWRIAEPGDPTSYMKAPTLPRQGRP